MRQLTVVDFYRLGFTFRPHSDSSQLVDLCVLQSEEEFKRLVTLIPMVKFEEVLEVATDLLREWGRREEGPWREACKDLGL